MPKHKAVVLGGSGYVGGEVVRLLLGHPDFELVSVGSQSFVGQRIDAVFPHLSNQTELTFSESAGLVAAVGSSEPHAIFAALPHGESACAVAELLATAHPNSHVVDLSADFRFATSDGYAKVYGHPHPVPALLPDFSCALPDLGREIPSKHIAHPGCFTTAFSLATAPLVRNGLINGPVTAFGVTGSTGSGRPPKPGTHHPDRHSGLWAYEPLRHRHTAEMEMLIGGKHPVHFLPHSGPFSRGIHMTVTALLARAVNVEEVVDAIRDMYMASSFVTVSSKLPSVKEVVGSNRCHLGVAVERGQIVVTSVIDNLVKGAAGGAVQWMNRLFNLEETRGLTAPSVGWN